jgi:hypothetical protein
LLQLLVDAFRALLLATVLADERAILIEFGRIGVFVFAKRVRLAVTVQWLLVRVERSLTLLVRFLAITTTGMVMLLTPSFRRHSPTLHTHVSMQPVDYCNTKAVTISAEHRTTVTDYTKFGSPPLHSEILKYIAKTIKTSSNKTSEHPISIRRFTKR